MASAKSLVQSCAEELSIQTGKQSIDPAILPEIFEDLCFADRELDRAKEFVASLLGLSRQTKEYTETVDVNAVVKAPA